MMRRSTPTQAGFSTIEALISIVILAVVALGMAGMTAQSARQQKNAHHLYRATLLLNDLGERVRASQSVAVKGAFASALNFGVDAPVPKQDCFATACTVEETAVFELEGWLAKVRTELPNGAAHVSYAPQTAVDGGLYTVMLVWREVGVVTGTPNTGANDPACIEVAALAANQQARCFTSRVGV